MAAHDESHDAAPPAGEQIHMPAPSLIPVINAAGLALAIVGITISRFLVILGLLIFLVSLAFWIRDARRDFDELPADHHAGH